MNNIIEVVIKDKTVAIELQGTFVEYAEAIKNASTVEELDNNFWGRFIGKVTDDCYGFTEDQDNGVAYKDFPWCGIKVRFELIYKGWFSKTFVVMARNTDNLLGVFCSNEGAVNGLLASVNSGSTLADGVKVVGFDAGAGQKAAVMSGLFMGSITQDPFMIGYLAVELAVKASNGESVSDVDTGAKWYDAGNMDEADIAQLLYD